MHSSQLPVTEWWDPEWDVYDVPGSPYDYQQPGADPQEADFDVWWAAYDHVAEIGYITTGERWYSPPNLYQHQLTTGSPQPRPRPVERFGRPPACMCLYGLRPVAGIPGTHELDPFRQGWRRGVHAFRIHPKCPHHGEGRR